MINPNIEIKEIKNMLSVDRMQLYKNIDFDKLLISRPLSKLTKHCVIRFPPKNCKAPNRLPLCVSLPEIPILVRIEDPVCTSNSLAARDFKKK